MATEFMINDALAFVSVVDTGSLASAAKQWGITSSVISKRITRLEGHLRVQLLQRSTRSIALTEAGQLFYERCKRIRAEINDAAADVLSHHQKPSGLVRVNAPMSFGQVHLVPAVNEFVRLYPDIQIEVVLGSQYANFIHSGLDLAIFINDLPNTTLLKSKIIAQRNTGIYGTPEYFKQFGIPKNPQDLTHHNCLIYQADPGIKFGVGQKYEWVFSDRDEQIRIPVTGNVRINSSQALVKSALAGLGLVRLSSFMVTEELKAGALISVLGEYCPHDIDIHAAYPNQRYVPSKVKVFIDFLMERFRPEQYWGR